MNRKIIPVIILFVFSIQGCGGFKTVEMSAVLSNEQQEGYMETITSQKKHFVSLAPYGENIPASNETVFILFVKNCGEGPIDISSKNISAKFFGNTNKWASKSITILSHEELMIDLRRKQLDAELAVNSSLKTNYYRTYDTDGNYTGTAMKIYYEPSIYNDSAESYNAAGRKMLVVEELVLQPQTLQPGEGGGGLVVCDTTGMNSKIVGNFHFMVYVNGEQHEFTFRRSLKK